MNKKKGYLIVLALIVTLGVLVLFKELKEPTTVKAAGGAFALNTSSTATTSSLATIISTSTLNYLEPGVGTTSVTAYTGGSEELRVNVFILASSTATTTMDLRWIVEFSHSTTTVAADQVWFAEPATLNSNATTSILTGLSREYMYQFASSTRHQVATSTATINRFDPATTAALTFRISDIVAQWTRIVFYIPTMGGGRFVDTTALGLIPTATSSNAGIQIFPTGKDPL